MSRFIQNLSDIAWRFSLQTPLNFEGYASLGASTFGGRVYTVWTPNNNALERRRLEHLYERFDWACTRRGFRNKAEAAIKADRCIMMDSSSATIAREHFSAMMEAAQDEALLLISSNSVLIKPEHEQVDDVLQKQKTPWVYYLSIDDLNQFNRGKNPEDLHSLHLQGNLKMIIAEAQAKQNEVQRLMNVGIVEDSVREDLGLERMEEYDAQGHRRHVEQYGFQQSQFGVFLTASTGRKFFMPPEVLLRAAQNKDNRNQTFLRALATDYALALWEVEQYQKASVDPNIAGTSVVPV